MSRDNSPADFVNDPNLNTPEGMAAWWIRPRIRELLTAARKAERAYKKPGHFREACTSTAAAYRDAARVLQEHATKLSKVAAEKRAARKAS